MLPLSIIPTIIILLMPKIVLSDSCKEGSCPQTKPSAGITGPAPTFLGRDMASGCACRELHAAFAVCFGRSTCNSIPLGINITTPVLKITNTLIIELKPGDFDTLNQLENLQIVGNYNLSNILPGTFNSGLLELTNMSISFNPRLTSLHPRSFEGLLSLQTIYLIKNGFQSVFDATQSLSLEVLPSLLKLSLNENDFRNISNVDFTPMENSTLKELNLVLCRLEYFDLDCFAPLKNLQILRLGENGYNSTTISNVIAKTVEMKIPLRQLNLYSSGFRKDPPKELLEVVAKSNISNLNLARNQFEVISRDSFPYMPNIETLDLREVLALEVEPEAFYNLPNMKTLLLGGNKLESVPEDAIPSNLTHLEIQQNSGNAFHTTYFSIKSGKFINMTHLEYLNLSFNKLSYLFNESFVGLNNLETLGLKNGSIFQIHNNSFSPLKNLLILNLENNYFVSNNYPLGIDLDVFKGLDKLQVLLLGGCGITYFSQYGNPFVHLKNLRHLGLEGNKITDISPTDFAPLLQLRSIDISDNQLVAWRKRIFKNNSMLKTVILNRNRLRLLSVSMLEDFSNVTALEVETNPFSCDCDSYSEFKQWLTNSDWSNVYLKIQGYCAFPDPLHNYSLMDYFDSVHNGTNACGHGKKSPFVVLLPLVLLLIVFVSLATVVFYYRWHIRYWIFLTRLYLSRKGRLKPNVEKKCYSNYMYDAFVSYSNEDRNFVVRLVSMLENYEPFLKLCVYDRDFQIGSMISESVLESVAKSRRTLLIVSDNYAKSQWCRWESQIAEHHRLFFEDDSGEFVDDTLILEKLGPVNASHLTPTLKYLLKTRIYLQWEAEERKQMVFWDKLRQALAPPKDSQFILQNTRL